MSIPFVSRTGQARVSRRTKMAIAAGVVVVMLASGAAWAAMTTPQVIATTPAHSTRDAAPTVAVMLRNAEGLRSDHVSATVGSVDVSDRVAVSGGTVTVELPRLDDGEHELQLSTARFGLMQHRFEERVRFTVDTQAPPLQLVEPATATVETNTHAATLRVRSEPGATIEVLGARAEGNPVAGDDGAATVGVALREGRQRVHLIASDSAGNRTRTAVQVTADTVAPKLRFQLAARLDSSDLVLPLMASDATAVQVAATVNGSDSGIEVGQDAPGSFRITRDKPLAEGTHTIAVTARDRFGNERTVERTVLVDSSETLGENTIATGARGEDVRQLHMRLQDVGAFDSSAHPREWSTKTYGSGTAAAVCSFQRERGLEADCVAGSNTIAAISLKIVISRAAHTLTLYRNGKVAKTYPVAVGSERYPTPTGSFVIINMQKHPTWFPPDSDWARGQKPVPPGPDNPLGTRWMGISSPNVGIHGTNSPASIGYSVTHGCIRMRIPDVEELFEIVHVGTPVTIT